MWRGPLPIVGTVVVAAVSGIFDAVAAGTAPSTIRPTAGATPLAAASGKPLILYVGAEYCPYRASQRWSLIVAHARFGTWNGLSLSRYKEGSIPFLSFADRYIAIGSGYPPDVLTGKSWDDIATALRDPTTPIAKAVIGDADRMTAAICRLTQTQPQPVCSSPSVQGLLPAGE